MKSSKEMKARGDVNEGGCETPGTMTRRDSCGSSMAEVSEKNVEEAASATDFALSLLRGFRSVRGSSGSNGGSDTNSGLVSLSNNSFLFQFDGEEGALTNGSFPTSESDNNKNGGGSSDSDGDGRNSRSSNDPQITSHNRAPLQHGPNTISISSDEKKQKLVTGNKLKLINGHSHSSAKSSLSSVTMASASQHDLDSAPKNALSKNGALKSIARDGARPLQSLSARDGGAAAAARPTAVHSHTQHGSTTITGSMQLLLPSVVGTFLLDTHSHNNGTLHSFFSFFFHTAFFFFQSTCLYYHPSRCHT